MKVVVSAGGTGGHIYPTLAIVNKIKEKEPLSEFLYIGTTDRMEHELIPKLGLNYVGLEIEGISRKNLFKNIKVFRKYRKALKKSKKVLEEFKPDIVIGAGGYVTVPVLLGAHKLNYKTLIHEQNSVSGISNKFLAKYVDKVCVSLPKSLEFFPKEKVVYTGNPRSEEIVNTTKLNKSLFGLNQNKKLVVIVMGSLGSTTMTEKIKKLLPEFNDKDYEVMVVTGKKYYDEYKEIKVPKNVFLIPFLDNLIGLLKSTDLIISRAGASTIAEITAIGLPSILVPSPYVTNNHQYKNAKELEEVGASRLISEDAFEPKLLVKEIDNILNNDILYKSMQSNSKKLGITDSATKIYNEIIKTIEDDSK